MTILDGLQFGIGAILSYFIIGFISVLAVLVLSILACFIIMNLMD